MPEISKIRRGTADEANYVRNKLIEFNSKQVPNGVYEEVNLCVKDRGDRIIAGLNSVICWNWMEIDILWVDDEHRGSGQGKGYWRERKKLRAQSSVLSLN